MEYEALVGYACAASLGTLAIACFYGFVRGMERVEYKEFLKKWEEEREKEREKSGAESLEGLIEE